jgi:hypothetical protein
VFLRDSASSQGRRGSKPEPLEFETTALNATFQTPLDTSVSFIHHYSWQTERKGRDLISARPIISASSMSLSCHASNNFERQTSCLVISGSSEHSSKRPSAFILALYNRRVTSYLLPLIALNWIFGEILIFTQQQRPGVCLRVVAGSLIIWCRLKSVTGNISEQKRDTQKLFSVSLFVIVIVIRIILVSAMQFQQNHDSKWRITNFFPRPTKYR